MWHFAVTLYSSGCGRRIKVAGSYYILKYLLSVRTCLSVGDIWLERVAVTGIHENDTFASTSQ
jgi:hypothetical protein